MSASSKQSGTWDTVRNIYGKTGGTWTRVKRAFVKQNGTWTQFHSGNVFEVYSLGLEQNVVTASNRGLWTNGATGFAGNRSYALVTFDQYGNILTSNIYDVFGDSTNYANAGSATQNLIAALGAIPAGTPYVICTYDEPSTNANALTSAISNLFGGTPSIIASTMPYRGAYLAIGLANQAPVLETYCGTFMNSVSNPSASSPATDQGCLDAILDYTFRVYNGQIVNLAQQRIGSNVVSNSHAVGAVAIANLV
jgi:hypothetical protein